MPTTTRSSTRVKARRRMASRRIGGAGSFAGRGIIARMISLPPDFVLTTERLRLRVPSEADMASVFEASRTPGFNDGMLWDPPATMEELRGPYERAVAAWREGKHHQFTIEEREEGRFVGRISLRSTGEAGVLDVGYWTHPARQGRGFMTEALAAVLELAFEGLGAEAVVADYAVWNVASGRLLAGAGFTTLRVVPGGFVKGGRVSDEAQVRLGREGWEKGRTSQAAQP